jgi:hypothetical protein
MLRYLRFVLLLMFCSPSSSLLGQTGTATVHGTVTDPTGAVIPGASVSIITPGGQTIISMITDSLGAYQSRSLAPGTYIVVASAQGFASSSSQAVTLASGQSVQYSVALQIQVEQQDIQVDADAPTVDTDPDKNANAIVLKGKDLDALSDDPDELQNELQPLAGPSTGPNGGQSYVDGILAGTYPATPIAVPAENNMQYQSGGVYRQNQIIASLTARYSRFSLTSVYTFNGAKAERVRLLTLRPLQLILDSIMAGRVSIYVTALCF